jgi:hypothetical protein
VNARLADGSLTERELVGEERRLAARGLTPEKAMADLHRLLGHSAGASLTSRIRDLAGMLEIGESTITNVRLRIKPIGEILVQAMYGDAPNGTLHADWQGEPADWGPVEPITGTAAGAATVTTAASSIEPSPRLDDEPCVPVAGEAVAAVQPPPTEYTAAEPVTVPLRPPLPPGFGRMVGEASDNIVNADAVAPAAPPAPAAIPAPFTPCPITAAIDMLKGHLEQAEQRVAAAKAELTTAQDRADQLAAAIHTLRGLLA